MAGRGELYFPKTCAISLKEQLARTHLKNVISLGHPYVELREDGKRFIFFCTLCLAPCYSDSVLFDHLKGSLHTERLSAAKLTLLKPNPWPFSDGVRFFGNTSVIEKQFAITNGDERKSPGSESEGGNLAIVKYGDKSKSAGSQSGAENLSIIAYDENLVHNGNKQNGMENAVKCLVVPRVLIRDELCNLTARFIGSGRIAARMHEKDGLNEITRIWCEWLGKEGAGREGAVKILDHDFAVLTFSYYYDLGIKGVLEDVKLLLSSSPQTEPEEGDIGSTKKRKKSFSDPEDISESWSKQFDSSGEESSASMGVSSPKLLLESYDDQLFNKRLVSSKTVRRELRRQQRIAAERMCGICQQKMLPEKDVGALMNLNTGKLACSSRNTTGAFHVFHISCLIHWIVFCEFEMAKNQSLAPKVQRKSRRKNGLKGKGMEKDGKVKNVKSQIDTVFCPECQGTGVNIDGEERERPSFPLSEMFKYKIKVSDGHRAWMKNPEALQNCSTGFHFPSQTEDAAVQEKVSALKLLNFYRADLE